MLSKSKRILLYIFLCKTMLFIPYALSNLAKEKIVICTAADDKYFDLLLNLIGSLHRINFNELKEIAVYNLGLNNENRKVLARIKKLQLYNVEMTHPDLLKRFVISKEQKSVPGWYAWKPVIIKQTLDKFPVVLYLDAGNTVLQPLDDLFKHIEQNGYFLMSVYHNIRWCTTKIVIDRFNLQSDERKFILDDQTLSISANIIGGSRKIYNSLILPMYNLTKDLRYFADDGSTPDGFGTCRHDQTLWSIYARLLGLDVKLPGWMKLNINNKPVKFHSHWIPHELNEHTAIYQSRWDSLSIEQLEGLKITKENIFNLSRFIKYKEGNDGKN
ncbi:hypothetical protein H0X48_00980 [Candidatus Dependentiae bacterium]|nr:hypothetical protein [Candidatus Dependentiae bacterium]